MTNGRVFLVDGFADERDMYAQYLAMKAFDVQAFNDPQAAINELAPSAPVAIVTRIEQTKSAIDGTALATIVRRERATRDAAIVAITTSMLLSDRKAALRAGCDACLMLPVTPDHLLAVLRSALRSRNRRRLSRTPRYPDDVRR